MSSEKRTESEPFLAPKAFEFKEGEMLFKGKAGVVQIRPKEVTLTLSSGSEIRYRGHIVTSDKPISRRFPVE